MNKKTSKPNTIRILGGTWKGRKLPVLNFPGLRPTGCLQRARLFNWLSNDLLGKSVLDVFSGSGALGLEAASRGASLVWLLEKQKKVVASLYEKVKVLKAKQVFVKATDSFSFLNQPSMLQFDYVFLDPPFAENKYERLFELLESHQWLNPTRAFIYVESKLEIEFKFPKFWKLLKRAQTKQLAFHLFLKENSKPLFGDLPNVNIQSNLDR